jgi:spermidine synthase
LVTFAPYAALLPLTALAAGLLGAQLPLICHFGLAPVLGVGADFSRVYLANIIGSTLGSLVTGFFLLDALGLQRTSLLFVLLGCVMAASLAWLGNAQPRQRVRIVTLSAVAGLLALTIHGVAYDQLYERLQLKDAFTRAQRFAEVVESRSGVVTVTNDAAIFGGGIYDGRFNVSPIDDVNSIVRIYALSLLHPAPARVLGIGLSGGSWAQVIAHHPQLQSATMVEINRSYLDLIGRHAVVASLLRNPKVQIVVDDGRRYLARTDERFDVIVSNTTYHWRASASNLLSVEFLQLLRAHLRPGGVVMYNATGSTRVFHTACTVFPHVMRLYNFVVASDAPFDVDTARFRRTLERYAIDGQPVFEPHNPLHQRRLMEIVALPDTLRMADPPWEGMEDGSSLCRRVADQRAITDDDMGTEWQSSVAAAFVVGCQDEGSCTP